MRYDVAVIGAGPAGSFAAEKLSSLGHKTIIIDPCDKKKVCAGILTAQYAREYKVDEAYVERELKGVRLSFRDIRAEIKYRKAVEYSIDREAFDSFNLNEAINSGACLRKDMALSLEENGTSLAIRTTKEQIVADYAIIASGVSDLSSLCGGAKKYACCVQQKKDGKPDDYFEMNLMRGGYSWSAPKKNHVLTGTSSPNSYPDIPGERGLIPLEPAEKTFSNRFLLTGDAAGFVSPFEGEGIFYARRSGEIAADVLSGAISGNNALESYEKRWQKEFDFSTLAMLARFLSNDMVLEAFVREIRDNGRFNKLVEDILTKKDKFQVKNISSLIKTLV
ncbi:MAG: NAD(P)/FAD-dependent oxidoreductase [Candidatus Methanoperedens sp.]|nr:NAD(P)/FAD-dependent oxidoreductase [Candidatus Methanoperedens sp.]MCZ7403678.1 NAD(P)/FAD-dependent oxidoreductase [Candidatus Methanoperedens sp.]